MDALIFDVGQVLYRWDLRFLFRQLIADPAELEWFVTTVVTPQWHFQVDEGRALADIVTERCAEFPDHAPLILAYATRFNETIAGPVDGMVDLIAELERDGVPLFAITNFGAEFWADFRPTARLMEPFRDILVSGEEKLAKPDPAIFTRAIARFGVDPARSLFIDDRADNVAAAESVGLIGHHFTDAARLRRALGR